MFLSIFQVWSKYVYQWLYDGRAELTSQQTNEQTYIMTEHNTTFLLHSRVEIGISFMRETNTYLAIIRKIDVIV